MSTDPLAQKVLALQRPHPALWRYYILRAILTGPGVIITLPYLFFRYHTLRYRFDAEGIHMKVGILFRQEVNLTYARVQDIHLRSGFIQRWLGLADLEVQTASGSARAELVIEGFKEFEMIRDFLYTRMRGYQTTHQAARPDAALTPAIPGAGAKADGEVVSLLLEIRDELRRTREALKAPDSDSRQPPGTHV